MIFLESLTYNKTYLDAIAKERNKTLISLRSDWSTEGLSQDKWILNLNPDKERYFYIYIKDSYTKKHRLMGYCGLDKINYINQTAELSLMVFEDYKRRGFGIEIVGKLLGYGFLELNLNCIYIEVYMTTDIWEFWEKCGFKKEGILRQRKKWKDKLYDSIIGSLLKNEIYDC